MNKNLNEEVLNNVSGGKGINEFRKHHYVLTYVDRNGVEHTEISQVCNDSLTAALVFADLVDKIKRNEHLWLSHSMQVVEDE